MASAKAMARMDWTRIFVAAPGLRPTASEAFMPMKPTPRAPPNAASPTCMFPVSSANIGINDIYAFLSLLSRRLPRLNTVKPPKFCKLMGGGGRFVPFFVCAFQHHEYRGQEHEDQRLNEPNQEFHKIKGYWQQPAEARHQGGHRFEHIFACEYIAVKPEA